MILFSIILSSLIYAAVQFPHSFHGTAKVGTSDVASGTIVTARIGGEVKGSFIMTEAGYYGNISSNPPTHLPVAGSATEDYTGQTITFYMGCEESPNTTTWSTGAINTLNLQITGGYCGDGSCNNGESAGTGNVCTSSTNTCQADCGTGSTGDDGSSSGGGGGAGTSTPTGGGGAIVSKPAEKNLDDYEGFEDTGIILEFKKGQKATFNLDGTDYEIEVDKVEDDYIVLKTGDQVLTVKVGQSLEIDVDNDGQMDIRVELLSIKDGKAEIKYTKIVKEQEEIPSEEKPPEESVCGNNICEDDETPESCPQDCKVEKLPIIGWIIVGIVLVLGLGIYFLITKKKK